MNEQDIQKTENYLNTVSKTIPSPTVTTTDVLRIIEREGNTITPSPYNHIIMRYKTLVKVLAPITAVALIGAVALSRNIQQPVIPAATPDTNVSQVVVSTDQPDKTISLPAVSDKKPATITAHQTGVAVDAIVDDILSESKAEVRDAKLALSDYQSSYSTSTSLDAAINTDYAN